MFFYFFVNNLRSTHISNGKILFSFTKVYYMLNTIFYNFTSTAAVCGDLYVITIKLSNPVSIVDTLHAGFHVSGW